MQKDFQAFKQEKTLANAKRVLKHSKKISAQCVYGPELIEAAAIVMGGAV